MVKRDLYGITKIPYQEISKSIWSSVPGTRDQNQTSMAQNFHDGRAKSCCEDHLSAHISKLIAGSRKALGIAGDF